MQENEPHNLAFHWSTQFIRALYNQGVTRALISPGSRSTPLTLALAAHPGFKCEVVLDERSSAFIALGHAKASGIPSLLVCTSGTALANYAPAVQEATASGIPMIIASADRPPHLRGIGSSQTLDQLKHFGSTPVFFHEAGEPKPDYDALERIRTAAKQAFYYSTQKCGVAHVNFPFDKPLEPDADFLNRIEKENNLYSKQVSTNYNLEKGPSELGQNFWSQLISAERPVIIAGPTNKFEDHAFITPLARAIKAPILVEPGSHVKSSRNSISGFTGFLKSSDKADELKPDLIIRIGSYPVSKALSDYLKRFPSVMQIAFTHHHLWRDGDVAADRQIPIPDSLVIPDITGNASTSWLKKWKKNEKAYYAFQRETIQPTTPLTDGYIFSTLSKLLPNKAFSMISNSFPVRDMGLFGNYDGREIYLNRGAAGIDGICSTALGLSQQLNKPGVLYIGDLAFLHDSNALLNASIAKHPLVVIIINNGGGTIFRMLPVYKFKEKHHRYFETPQNVRIASLCRGYHVEHNLVSRADQLVSAFEEALTKNGVQVIECMTDADDSMLERHTMWNFSDQKNHDD